jgi:hypothetical protein
MAYEKDALFRQELGAPDVRRCVFDTPYSYSQGDLVPRLNQKRCKPTRVQPTHHSKIGWQSSENWDFIPLKHGGYHRKFKPLSLQQRTRISNPPPRIVTGFRDMHE